MLQCRTFLSTQHDFSEKLQKYTLHKSLSNCDTFCIQFSSILHLWRRDVRGHNWAWHDTMMGTSAACTHSTVRDTVFATIKMSLQLWLPWPWIMRAICLILIYTKLKRPYHGCASLSIYLLSSDCSFIVSACDCSLTWESCPPLPPLWWHTSFRQLCGSALEFYRVFVSSFWVTMATFTHTLKQRLSKSLLWSCPKQNIVVEAKD